MPIRKTGDSFTAAQVKNRIDIITSSFLESIKEVAKNCEEPIALQPIKLPSLFVNNEDTGFEIRVITQSYKETRGLSQKGYLISDTA
jgi:hypothetical protein